MLDDESELPTVTAAALLLGQADGAQSAIILQERESHPQGQYMDKAYHAYVTFYAQNVYRALANSRG